MTNPAPRPAAPFARLAAAARWLAKGTTGQVPANAAAGRERAFDAYVRGNRGAK